MMWRPLADEVIKDGLELLLDRRNYPVLIMCTTGIHETGTFVGCLRTYILFCPCSFA